VEFQPIIAKRLQQYNLPLLYHILDIHTIFEAGCARLHIFEYEHIQRYHKILYLDTDILIHSNINVLFAEHIAEDKLYALEEGVLDNGNWGGPFFDFSIYERDRTAFTSGILYFKNHPIIQGLFRDILNHIQEYIYRDKNEVPGCLDQPFIVYQAVIQNKYDNQMMKKYAENNPEHVDAQKIIYHFCGGVGIFSNKYKKMTEFWPKMNTIRACTIADSWNENKMKLLLESAKANDFVVEIFGLNKPFCFYSKISEFYIYLSTIPADENPIICFTDAFDVFYTDSLECIKQKFLAENASLIWSVEKWFSHQLLEDKEFYENMTTDSEYKYINSGTFIGYKKVLLELLSDIDDLVNDSVYLEKIKTQWGWDKKDQILDQCLFAHQLRKKWDKYNVKLDTTCNIFYVVSGEWDNIENRIENRIENHITEDMKMVWNGNSPSIIHVPDKRQYEHILNLLYAQKYHKGYYAFYKKNLCNKTYTWRESYITFLKNGKMNAFGVGSCSYVEKNTFIAYCGGRYHTLTFTDDFSEFVSIRQGDNERIVGKLYE
jgi:lipopolysaccharide biosynthesis glycosyltransferase